MEDILKLSYSEVNDMEYNFKRMASMSEDEIAKIDKNERMNLMGTAHGMTGERAIWTAAPACWFRSPDDFLRDVCLNMRKTMVEPMNDIKESLLESLKDIIDHIGQSSVFYMLADNIETVQIGKDTGKLMNNSILPIVILNEMLAIISLADYVAACTSDDSDEASDMIYDMLSNSTSVTEWYASINSLFDSSEDTTGNKIKLYKVIIPLNFGETALELYNDTETALVKIQHITNCIRTLLASKQLTDIYLDPITLDWAGLMHKTGVLKHEITETNVDNEQPDSKDDNNG